MDASLKRKAPPVDFGLFAEPESGTVVPNAGPLAARPATIYESAGGKSSALSNGLREAVRALARRKGRITVVDVKADAECAKYLPPNDSQRALALLGGIMQSAGLKRAGDRYDPVSRNRHTVWAWDL